MSNAMVAVSGNTPIDMMNLDAFTQVQRVGQMFAASDIVPQQYRNNVANCSIALMQATRMGVDPFAFMQASYVVHGRPGIESKLAISLINASGLFVDPLDYEEVGDNPKDDGYRVRCVAKRKSTGKELKGPWIDWDLVKAEGWDKKQGSKWKTMPQLMFMYRAAMFFARIHCPEVLLGFQTTEELHDIEAVDITQQTVSEASMSDQIQLNESDVNQTDEEPAQSEQMNLDDSAAEEKAQPEEKQLTKKKMRSSIHDLLAMHFDGDTERMDAALQEIVGHEEATIENLPRFDEALLPEILEKVEMFTGESC